MTAKIYANMRTILRGVFKYAKRKRYTDISITIFFGDLDLSKKVFRKKIVEKEKEVFSESEVKLIMAYLWNRGSIRDLGVLLAFQMGARVGELCCLKFEDVVHNGKCYIYEEQKLHIKMRQQVKEYVKPEISQSLKPETVM